MKRQHAFTLIEILVALFIFAVLSSITATALYTSLNTQRSTQDFSQRLTQLQLAVRVLQNDFAQASAQSLLVNGRFRLPALSGAPRSVEFTRRGHVNPLNQLARSELQRVQYYLEGDTLIRKSWNAISREQNTPHQQQRLLDQVTAIEFAYFSIPKKFYPNWPTGMALRSSAVNGGSLLLSLPQAVKITLRLKQAGELVLLFTLPGGSE